MREDTSFKVLNVRVYENDWDYSRSVYLDVANGKVRIIEDDHNARKPDTLWREITGISLSRMMQILVRTLQITSVVTHETILSVMALMISCTYYRKTVLSINTGNIQHHGLQKKYDKMKVNNNLNN